MTDPLVAKRSLYPISVRAKGALKWKSVKFTSIIKGPGVKVMKKIKKFLDGRPDIYPNTKVRFHEYMLFVCKKSDSPKVRFEILGKESTV
jgi:hypothetical protein